MLSSIWIVLAALAVILAVRALADRLQQSSAVLLVLAGLLLSVLPLPSAALEPHVILNVIIPPLLYIAAKRASRLDLRSNRRAIASLSVALVVATAFAVGLGLMIVVPGLGFAAALALGAAVSPPDPVASLEIGRRAGLPTRLRALIEGEGLLNDATALTLYGLAVTAALGGGFTAPEAGLRFLLAVAGGILCGLIVARVIQWILRRTDDVLIENAISLATPFLAFGLAELIHGSGVLAVVVAGLSLIEGRKQVTTGESRLQTAAVWRIVEYLLEGYVFLLIGQQAPDIIRRLSHYDDGIVLAATVTTVVIVLGVRLAWMLVLGKRVSGDRSLSPGDAIALWWAGTRGVITLATAYALPLDFPFRDLFLFLAFVVVLVTLVGQGFTFAPLLRRLGLRTADDGSVWVRVDAQAAAFDAAIDLLSDLESVDELDQDDPVVRKVAERHRQTLIGKRDRLRQHLDYEDTAERPAQPDRSASIAVRRAVLDAQREELIRRRDSGHLTDSDLRILELQLDAQELTGI